MAALEMAIVVFASACLGGTALLLARWLGLPARCAAWMAGPGVHDRPRTSTGPSPSDGARAASRLGVLTLGAIVVGGAWTLAEAWSAPGRIGGGGVTVLALGLAGLPVWWAANLRAENRKRRAELIALARGVEGQSPRSRSAA